MDRQTDGRTELRWLRRAIAVPAVACKNWSQKSVDCNANLVVWAAKYNWLQSLSKQLFITLLHLTSLLHLLSQSQYLLATTATNDQHRHTLARQQLRKIYKYLIGSTIDIKALLGRNCPTAFPVHLRQTDSNFERFKWLLNVWVPTAEIAKHCGLLLNWHLYAVLLISLTS